MYDIINTVLHVPPHVIMLYRRRLLYCILKTFMHNICITTCTSNTGMYTQEERYYQIHLPTKEGGRRSRKAWTPS